ncbi:hypothetical protein DAPPUDRAFT_301868 [Daphnia pulex]|uniref:Uncharacterized protein n=1 Tax=Daphnia pulex TaxID=6669 RepID=E9GAW7_DAPPU|nr:hypothetical protein DAPPUDRAFT_301868 [Daphnia pulex]|eukprot:EFX83331.1 hypothetical protein DAPPUDRAFT_301868 [Daphnia pulex]
MTIHSTASQRQRTIHNAHAGRLFSRGNHSGGIDIGEAIFTGESISTSSAAVRSQERKRITRFNLAATSKAKSTKKTRQTRFFLISTIEWRPEPLASLCHFRPDIPFRQNSKFPVSTIPVGIH